MTGLPELLLHELVQAGRELQQHVRALRGGIWASAVNEPHLVRGQGAEGLLWGQAGVYKRQVIHPSHCQGSHWLGTKTYPPMREDSLFQFTDQKHFRC